MDLPKIRRAWARFLDRERAESSVEVYRRGVGYFLAWCELKAIDPAQASRGDVLRYRDDLKRRGYSPATISLRVHVLRAFYAWLIDNGAPIENPCRNVKVKGQSIGHRHRRDELTEGEIRAVLGTCGDKRTDLRDRAILALMVYCALRTVEIRRADLSNLQTRDGRAILWVWGKGRSDPDDFVVLPAPAEAMLRDWLAVRPGQGGPVFVSLSPRSFGRAISLRYLRQMILTRYRRVGILNPRKTAHSLRHSAISNAIRHGATPLQAQSMARHSDMRSTLIYYHERGRMEAPAEDLIDYSEPVAEAE